MEELERQRQEHAEYCSAKDAHEQEQESRFKFEIPPSAPVTREERDKWLAKAEYGGKTRRLIDHIERLEECAKSWRFKCMDADDRIDELYELLKKAEAERDATVSAVVTQFQYLPPCCGRSCPTCRMFNKDYIDEDTCLRPENAMRECWIEWAQIEVGRKDENKRTI